MSQADDANQEVKPDGPLRSGWTTGACATAAAKAAAMLLCGDDPVSSVTITLPRGQRPSFAVTDQERGEDWARAAVIKDAGDDPDVTHGAMLVVTLRPRAAGHGLTFAAGEGVGMVTKPGLPIPPGEPAINPVPRQMMQTVISEEFLRHGWSLDVEVEVSIPGGEALAQKTWNPRLGIVGGLSVLGTTGIVVPYSCSAWIHSIQRGVDVARATGVTQVAGCVGKTSERAVRTHLGLPAEAIIDMGDFAGGLLKYLRHHPIDRVIIAGGFAKICKLADGHMDLHSRRSQVDLSRLAQDLAHLGAPASAVEQASGANTALDVLRLAQRLDLPLAQSVAQRAHRVAASVTGDVPIHLTIVAVDREGQVIAQADLG